MNEDLEKIRIIWKEINDLEKMKEERIIELQKLMDSKETKK